MSRGVFLSTTLLVITLILNAAGENPYTVCPSHYVSDTSRNKCLRFHDSRVTWDAASNTCKQEGGNLTTIPDEDTDQFVKQMLEDGQGYWIGLRGQHLTTAPYNWADGSTTVYNGFEPEQPSHQIAECVQITSRGWNDKLCDSKLRRFVCEQDFHYLFTCRDGWTNHPTDKTCYKILHLGSSSNWNDARVACQEERGDLVTMSDPRTKDFIIRLVNPNIHNVHRYFIGLWDPYKDDGKITFEWIDGTALNSTEETWFTHSDNEHCGTLHYRQSEYVYSDRNCFESYGYPAICRSDILVVKYPFVECPDAYMLYVTESGYVTCLRFVESKNDTWYGAGEDCKNMEGELFSYKEGNVDLNALVDTKLTAPRTYWMAHYDKFSKLCRAYVYNNLATTGVTHGYEVDPSACNGSNTQNGHRYICQNLGILTTSADQRILNTVDVRSVSHEDADYFRNATAATSSQNDSTTPPTQHKLCPCKCSNLTKMDFNPSPDVLAQIISNIQNELRVDEEKTSLKRNKKKCADDSRTGSQAIGYISVFLCAIPLCILLVADITRIFQPRKHTPAAAHKNTH